MGPRQYQDARPGDDVVKPINTNSNSESTLEIIKRVFLRYDGVYLPSMSPSFKVRDRSLLCLAHFPLS